MKKWIIILLFITIAIEDFNAQHVNDSYLMVPYNKGLSSPQSAEFAKYGNVGINYYNGLLNFEIPLYNYKDNDFEIPISIKYNSEGFKPNKRSTLTGYNWILNAGGIITRTVNGSPDDVEGNFEDNDYKYMNQGILAAVKEGTFHAISQESLWYLTMPVRYKQRPYYSGDTYFDMEPDVFHFQFGKHSGDFIIRHNGSSVVAESLGDDGYIIKINKLAVQTYSKDAAPVNSSITIITPDGYTYSFGGSTDYLEYFFPNNPERTKVRPRYITSWYLNRITAPNNRKVELFYESKEQINKYVHYTEEMVKRKPDVSPYGRQRYG